TRSKRDWSSDVCSSDLISGLGSWRMLFLFSIISLITLPFFRKYLDDDKSEAGNMDILGGTLLAGAVALFLLAITQGYWLLFVFEIGRASCRDRVWRVVD